MCVADQTGAAALAAVVALGFEQLQQEGLVGGVFACTARMLCQLLGRRRAGPVFLSTRRAPDDGTARPGTIVGATEADLMKLSGPEDRRTLQRYLKPSKEGTHRRLDDIDARRGNRIPSADELAARVTTT